MTLAQLVCTKVPLECDDSTLYTTWGTVLDSCMDLMPNMDVYFVPQGRLFVWPSHDIGYKVNVKHIPMPTEDPIIVVII
jgi:hypothetical protein